jgi:dihydroflavonol-4-reductase
MSERVNLVTGACGFSGSYVVRKLLSENQRVVATDISRAFDHPKTVAIRRNIGVDFSHPLCEVVPADLTDRLSTEKLLQKPVTHLFHTASLYDYSAPMDLLRKVNIQGTIHLLDALQKKKGLQRFVHWSTCGVFGKPHTAREGARCNLPFSEESSSPKNTPFGQEGPSGTHLVNDYSVTKWEQEQIVWKAHREQGLPLTVVRPAPIYGPGSDYGHGGILISVNQGYVPFVPRDAKNYITTSVHVEDMAGFACFIADQKAALGEDYNVADDSIISYYDFVRYLALLTGRRMIDLPFFSLRLARPVMTRAAEIWLLLEQRFHVPRVRVFEPSSATYMSSSYWVSNKKTKDAGYGYRYPDVREGMRDTVDWFRKMGWLDPGYNPKGAWKDYGLAGSKA